MDSEVGEEEKDLYRKKRMKRKTTKSIIKIKLSFFKKCTSL